MSQSHELELALQTVERGAAALRYAERAVRTGAGVLIHPEFTYKALTAPLRALSGLLGEDLPTASSPALEPPPAPRARRRPRRPRKASKRVSVKPSPTALPDPPDLRGFDERASAWDPDDQPFEYERPYSPDANSLLEAGACRALLLEIIRRAAYDWVLYRSSSKLPNRMLAESAYIWLFLESEEHSGWQQRVRNGKALTAFVSICELLDIDPDQVRAKVKLMTERDIMGAGRPAERRKNKNKGSSDEVMQAEDLRVFDVDVDTLPSFDPMFISEG